MEIWFKRKMTRNVNYTTKDRQTTESVALIKFPIFRPANAENKIFLKQPWQYVRWF